MITLAYFSSAAHVMSAGELSALLAQAQANNARAGVTGLLCHHDGSFLQFLEGEADIVDALFTRISRDPRHRSVLSMHRGPIRHRAFPDWAMALVNPSEVSDAQRAFARSLRETTFADEAASPELQALLHAFRAWLR